MAGTKTLKRIELFCDYISLIFVFQKTKDITHGWHKNIEKDRAIL